MPEPVIYFRESLVEPEELEAARRYFRVITQRTHARRGELVIPRFSALPHNKELCLDLEELGCTPINTYRQHCYVADLRNWYYDLAELTPRTWFALDQIPDEGPFFLKGATNSRKLLWETHAYAEDKLAAGQVFMRLAQDTTIGVQPIYVRKYVPLNRLATGLNSLPVSEEFRFFFLGGQQIASGFYWSSHVDELDRVYTPDVVPQAFVNEVVQLVRPHIHFWVADIARTADGDWILIELNDGQQAGLSEIRPDEFYGSLAEALKSRDGAAASTA
jgi:hypothetical protein